jgi:hypothetical protein
MPAGRQPAHLPTIKRLYEEKAADTMGIGDPVMAHFEPALFPVSPGIAGNQEDSSV